ncbi:hypothetical protein SERLADRAFT_436880 [Serpula lacrymans var. lacrymans S7.9]|uniref:Uncharacterized protein n=1 Tax=Serpula lacrymans var. lacrymans (strain S7.9) TaxID=578457 RepID=F8NTY7_SERL9|nr:uncharacterized protein SERLADRAFT_436880 [Serpula lacrymans var. lacrymans S7.9]EGO25114.1 hypothetical protein SERLADRAFT_436880 [Serpula lacrymans var. lacrymans S7.9]
MSTALSPIRFSPVPSLSIRRYIHSPQAPGGFKHSSSEFKYHPGHRGFLRPPRTSIPPSIAVSLL